MAETQIKFRRGNRLDPSIFGNLPNFGDLVYDGSTIIPEMLMNDCQPWVHHSKNYLFVGNVCVNPEWEGVTPIEVSGPWFEDDPDHSGEPEEWGKFINRVTLNYDTRYFSVVNGKLVVRLGNGLTLGANGIDVDFNNFGHYVATNVQRGEVKTSWDGLISLASDTAGLTIDGLYAGKSTGRTLWGENALYPTISEAGSWLWSYKYAPNNLFETISGDSTNGRLYTVIRPASSNLAGCVKVSKPLGRIDPSSTDQFPGPNSSYKWLSDSTSDASGCESSTTYLARLTNRYDLKANHGVDIDALMATNPYDPTYITPQLNPARRDTLFETFVPLPIPTYVHPGIAKLSYAGSVFGSSHPNFTPDSTLKTYPIGINSDNQLVTVGPRKLSDLANDLSINSFSDVTIVNPKSGDVLTYSGSEWFNEEPQLGCTDYDDLPEPEDGRLPLEIVFKSTEAMHYIESDNGEISIIYIDITYLKYCENYIMIYNNSGTDWNIVFNSVEDVEGTSVEYLISSDNSYSVEDGIAKCFSVKVFKPAERGAIAFVTESGYGKNIIE